MTIKNSLDLFVAQDHLKRLNIELARTDKYIESIKSPGVFIDSWPEYQKINMDQAVRHRESLICEIVKLTQSINSYRGFVL